MEWYTGVLKKYAEFNGRARRKEYWMFALFNALAIFVLLILSLVLPFLFLLYILYALGVLLPSLAVAVRRLHDTGRSGWWMLLSFVPLAGLVLLVFMVLEGTPGQNEYGPNPKEIAA